MISELRRTVILMLGVALSVAWITRTWAEQPSPERSPPGSSISAAPPSGPPTLDTRQSCSTAEPVCLHCKQNLTAPTQPTSTVLVTVNGWQVRAEHVWLAIGLIGQFFFGTRFFLQWLVSERRGESVVPMSFWWISLVAGLMVLSYGVYKLEPVIILSQLFNPVIYLRNIVLMQRKQRREELLASMGTADNDKPTVA